MIIGIDTGVSGGMTLMNDKGEVVECIEVCNRWEVLKSKTKAGKPKRRRRLKYQQIAGTLAHWSMQGAQVMVIERVHAMPHDGGSAAFSFGEAFGCFQAMAALLNMEIVLVTPQAWKKHFNLLGRDKDDSLNLARLSFGLDLFPLKKDHNRAESALIAAYGLAMQV